MDGRADSSRRAHHKVRVCSRANVIRVGKAEDHVLDNLKRATGMSGRGILASAMLIWQCGVFERAPQCSISRHSSECRSQQWERASCATTKAAAAAAHASCTNAEAARCPPDGMTCAVLYFLIQRLCTYPGRPLEPPYFLRHPLVPPKPPHHPLASLDISFSIYNLAPLCILYAWQTAWH